MNFQSKKVISIMYYMLFLIVIKKVSGVHFKGIIYENSGKYEIGKA